MPILGHYAVGTFLILPLTRDVNLFPSSNGEWKSRRGMRPFAGLQKAIAELASLVTNSQWACGQNTRRRFRVPIRAMSVCFGRKSVIAFFKPSVADGLDRQEYGISIASWFGMIAASSREKRFLLGH